MKIKTSDIELSYIKDFDEMRYLVEEIGKGCEFLDEFGNDLKKEVQFAEERFSGANYNRLKEALHRYMLKATMAIDETRELKNSVNEYEDNMNDIVKRVEIY